MVNVWLGVQDSESKKKVDVLMLWSSWWQVLEIVQREPRAESLEKYGTTVEKPYS